MAGRSPTRMTEAPNSRTAATAPATTTAGPWSPPMASTATFRLGPFDGDDLPTLVVAAVRADSVRQLDLAALRTERARRRGELVVRAALAPARLRVASFRQRHGGVSLARASRRQVSEYGQPRVRRAIPASAGHYVPVPAADGAQAQTVLTAEWLHRRRQAGSEKGASSRAFRSIVRPSSGMSGTLMIMGAKSRPTNDFSLTRVSICAAIGQVKVFDPPRPVCYPHSRMSNIFKTAMLLAVLTAMLVLIGGAFGGRQGMLVAFVLAALMNFASYWFSDKIVLAMYGARPVDEAQAPGLYAIVRRLTTRASLPMPRVYLTPTDTPNAFATGRNPHHAAIAVTEGIMRLLDDEELEGVLAHELAHVKNRDVLVSTIAATLAGAITYLAHMAQWAAMFGGRASDDEERGGNPLAL